MSITRVTLDHVNAAHQAHDSDLVKLFIQLVSQPPDPDKPSPPKDAFSFQTFLTQTRDKKFFHQPLNDQASQRIEKLKQLESPEVAATLEPRYHSHEFLVKLYESGDEFDRQCLLEIIRKVPLVYGPWKGLKRIFKLSEEANDTQIFGALAARFDFASRNGSHEVRTRTLEYLARRAWRYLRRLGESFPAMYAEAAVDVMVEYPEGALYECWLLNHIVHHQTESYQRTRFRIRYWNWDSNWQRHRAFPEAWKRSPLPLFTLLANARRNEMKLFAVSSLKLNFKNVLREIEPSWVRQLVGQNDAIAHQFVVWLFKNVPRFEQSAFRELELHDATLRLLNSPDASARKFACEYVRTHARDLSVDRLIELANHDDEQVRKLATKLLATHDPREDVGLEAWGQLLETRHGHTIAIESLRKHFGASELTAEWFRSRLLGGNRQAADFAAIRLTEIHDRKSLGVDYFFGLIRDGDPYGDQPTMNYAIGEIGKFDLSDADASMLEQLFLSTVWFDVYQLVSQGKLSASQFDAEFLKAISFHPHFDDCPQAKTARKSALRPEFIRYDESRAGIVFGWLSDIRTFTPDQIGFEWLMELVQRPEARYHDFATDLMIKAFLPADFAPDGDATEESKDDSTSDEINIDFEEATFVFTGKLATMTRAEAQKKVTAANGKNSGTVSKNLNFLVIGDEGSPMYGQGRKGSKQLKAESLAAEGHDVRVISETAFLQMLTGTQREFSEDAVEQGCQHLWDMLIDNPVDSPLGRFAIKYLRQHHPEICLAETDRPVDPGAEIPDSFLSFERVRDLLIDNRKPLRDFGLKLSEFEFARWSPPLESLVELCELPYPAVRQFVSQALLADDTPQSRRWRLDPENFDAEAVYRFCQSRDAETRAIGMKLIERHPGFREPKKLFMLAESPDRNVRAFVVRAFWSLYRDRFSTDSWKPTEPKNVKRDGRLKKDPDSGPRFGTGAPNRPDEIPAAIEAMQYFLRRILFEVSPARPPKTKGDQIGDLRIKPLPTRRGKILMIETVRDIAIEDLDFANAVHPVLVEFMDSDGKTEHDTCLVAVARIEKAHPGLSTLESQATTEGASQ